MKYLFLLLVAGCGGSQIQPIPQAQPVKEGFYYSSLTRTKSECGILPESKSSVLHFIREEDGTMQVTTEGMTLISNDDSYFVYSSGVPGIGVTVTFAIEGTDEGIAGKGELSIESPSSGCKDFASIIGTKISGKKN